MTIWTSYTRGIEAVPVRVDAVRLEPGRDRIGPTIEIAGLPDRVGKEIAVRIRSVMGGVVPPVRVTLDPAPCAGDSTAGLDLPVALAVREAMLGVIVAPTWAHGDLALTGELREARGLRVALQARPADFSAIVPRGAWPSLAGLPWSVNYAGSVVRGPDGAPTVHDFQIAEPCVPWPAGLPAAADAPDLGDAMFPAHALRALEVATVTRWPLLFVGPPGSGRTMLARRAVGLLPELDGEVRATVARIWSAAGLQSPPVRPPFRAPHHTVSEAGMVGSSRPARPGEVTLAHGGVLFLDEALDFARPAWARLQRTLREHEVRVGADRPTRLPARPAMVIAAVNPCACGPITACSCAPYVRDRYGARLEELARDFPLRVELRREAGGERITSAEARVRIERARAAGASGTSGHTVAAILAALDGAPETAEHRAMAAKIGVEVR